MSMPEPTPKAANTQRKSPQETAKKAKRHEELLPLHRYDDEGRVKPPVIYYWVIAYLMRGVIIVLGASGMGVDTKAVLGAFYSSHTQLYAHLFIGIPAIYSFFILSYRKQFYDNEKIFWLRTVKPTLILGIVLDFTLAIFLAIESLWSFSILLGATFFLNSTFIFILTKSEWISRNEQTI
ncbi:MAG: DUF2919 family protein [Alteromonadaceae bacterium]|nr:DUF2919 family protein [Alteromonadaceae bacterium]